MKHALFVDYTPSDKLKQAIEKLYKIHVYNDPEFRVKIASRNCIVLDRVFIGKCTNSLLTVVNWLKPGGFLCTPIEYNLDIKNNFSGRFCEHKRSSKFVYYKKFNERATTDSIHTNNTVEMKDVFSHAIENKKKGFKLVDIDTRGVELINLSTFLKILSDPTKSVGFSSAFRKSLENLYKYKTFMYTRILNDITSDVFDTQKQVREMICQGISQKQCEELFPFLKESIAFKSILIELIGKIRIATNKLESFNPAESILRSFCDKKIGLVSLIGRNEIKNHIVHQIYSFSKNYRVFADKFNNYALMGAAGSGKTQISKTMAYIYSAAGILVTNNTFIKTRVDLVGTHVGHTAPKTRCVLWKAMEGILMVDEAYQLGGTGNDFGSEAITEIVNFIDKYIGTCIIIVAGYEDKLKTMFFSTNEGLERRFPLQYILTPYTSSELCDILIKNINEDINIQLRTKDKNTMYTLFTLTPSRFLINSAGDVLTISSWILRIAGACTLDWKEASRRIIYTAFVEFVKSKEPGTENIYKDGDLRQDE